MYEKFKYERIALSRIKLDLRNPRIVKLTKPTDEDEVVSYFFKHENLGSFLNKIAVEGRNQGAERPYIIKDGKDYIVVEGNTRIATYKLLTGQIVAPEDHSADVPHVSEPVKADMLSVDCTIAPSRDALLPIMASAHFGLGDKSRWGYLGSRKAVYDEYSAGKSIAQLASAFDRKKGQIRDLILEYQLYLEALKCDWTAAEREELEDPAVEFNPPVRFLQTTGHLTAIGIVYDRLNLNIEFASSESKRKFYHLVRKLVVTPEKGLGATASYADVFADYKPLAHTETDSGGDQATDETNPKSATTSDGESVKETGTSDKAEAGGNTKTAGGSTAKKLSPGALFSYAVTVNNQVVLQLMKEAATINTTKFPAAGTGLLRCIVEVLLKIIIHDQGGNNQNKLLSLETALDICLSNGVQMSKDDKLVLKDFKKNHLDYVNLGVHGTTLPNHLRLMAARDSIDQFVMRNV